MTASQDPYLVPAELVPAEPDRAARPYPLLEGWPPGVPGPRRTSWMAIASLVLGISSVLFFFAFIEILPAGAAIILGHLARRRIRRTGEKGSGLALAGLILGYAWAAVWLLVTTFLVMWALAGGDG